jgi:hypothetical protein
MKNIKNNFTTKTVLALVFALTTAFTATANTNSDSPNSSKRASKTQSIIVQDLSQKLKADLSDTNLQVTLTNFEESKLSGNLVAVRGEANCILTNDQTALPLTFEAKLNPLKQTVSDIKYNFLESAENSYAPSTDEEILMKELMKQIGADYKTEQITIAIDNFKALEMDNNQTGYKGTGEVKIGQMVWNKIDFNVVMNNDKSSSHIKYDIKK